VEKIRLTGEIPGERQETALGTNRRNGPGSMTTITLLTDQALGEGTDTALDGLGFNTYARVLADAAAGTPGPFTIGVFGEWGTGKTSLMRLVEANLQSCDGVVTVWFNAWRYESEEHPIVPLVGTIVRSLERHKPFLEKLTEKGRSLIKALRAVAYGFSAKSKVKMPGFAEIEASFVAKDMIERSDRLTPDPLLDRSLYYEAFESLSSLKLPKETRIVVFIDDLDRCFPDRAIKLLESIKLVLSQPSFVFVMGVARRVIEGYLRHRYEKEYGIADFQGHSYLDKIVQLPFHIPPHTERMQAFSERLLERIDPSIREKLEGILPIIGQAAGGNPRATVRFVNNLLIDLGINAQLVEAQLMPPIPVEYFAITRCLQQRWPQVFSLFIGSDELCGAAQLWDREAISREVASGSPDTSALAAAFISDRDLLQLLQTPDGQSWLRDDSTRRETVQFLKAQRQDTEAGQRAATKRYDVFFSYSREDMKVVSQIAGLLSDRGVKVWLDIAELQPGARWQDAIENAFASTRTICFCIGKETFASGAVLNELVMAINRRAGDDSLRIIPLLLPGSNWSTVPKELQMYQGVDFSKGIDESQLDLLAKSSIR
jgi:hypothetical protein